jgi:hypothetical protein
MIPPPPTFAPVAQSLVGLPSLVEASFVLLAAIIIAHLARRG